jgi:hypothetical protein
MPTSSFLDELGRQDNFPRKAQTAETAFPEQLVPLPYAGPRVEGKRNELNDGRRQEKGQQETDCAERLAGDYQRIAESLDYLALSFSASLRRTTAS